MENRSYKLHRPGTPAPRFVNAFEEFAEGHLNNTQIAEPEPPSISDVDTFGIGSQPLQPWEFSLDLEQLENQSSLNHGVRGTETHNLDSTLTHPQFVTSDDASADNFTDYSGMGDWAFKLDESTPVDQDFLQWVDGAYRPPTPCSYCRYHRLQCLIIRTTLANPNPVSACSSCVALFRECSLAIGEKRKPSNFETEEPIYGNLHGVSEEQTGLEFAGCHWQNPAEEPINGNLHRISKEQTGLEFAGCHWQNPAEDSATGILPVSQSGVKDLPLPTAPVSKAKRAISKQAIKVLKTWLHGHQQTPYPSDEEKLELCSITGLTLLQISNWFANARRRQRITRSIPIPSRGRGPKIKTTPRESPEDSPLSRWKNSPPEDDPVDPSIVAQALSSGLSPFQDWVGHPNDSVPGQDQRGSFDGHSMSNWDTSQSGISSDSSNSAFSHSSWASHKSFSSLNRPRRRRNQKRKGVGNSSNTLSAIYHCTFCPDSFGKKHDWQRHEKTIHLPLEHWICCSGSGTITIPTSADPLPQCIFCGLASPTEEHLDSHDFNACSSRPPAERTFRRKDHLRQHVAKFHGCPAPLEAGIGAWKVEWGEVRSRCGFCDAWFKSWEERATHLAAHFRDGAGREEWAGDWGLGDEVLALLSDCGVSRGRGVV